MSICFTKRPLRDTPSVLLILSANNLIKNDSRRPEKDESRRRIQFLDPRWPTASLITVILYYEYAACCIRCLLSESDISNITGNGSLLFHGGSCVRPIISGVRKWQLTHTGSPKLSQRSQPLSSTLELEAEFNQTRFWTNA